MVAFFEVPPLRDFLYNTTRSATERRITNRSMPMLKSFLADAAFVSGLIG
jgi:hypothetical protein